MKHQFYITKSVSLHDNILKKNGGIFLETPQSLRLNTFLKTAYKKLDMNYPKFHKMDALCKLGILAMDVLTGERNLPGNTPLIFQNNASSLHTDEKHQNRLENPEKSISPAVFVYTLPNIVLGEISIKYKLNSEQVFFVSEKFDAGFLHNYTEILLGQNQSKTAISGWIDLNSDGYNVFLALISAEGRVPFTKENFEAAFKKGL